ncbi:MAG: DUF421 domain-containing protein [Pseudomonadota bacterium]|nr:DUF421 domain-containing protein [Pseudomonadota bacterium]
MTLDTLFGTSSQLDCTQELARAVLIFAYGLLLVRVFGRRVFGRWAALDIVVSIVIGSNLSRALTGNAQLWGTLAATALLLGLHWLLSHAVARSPWLSRIFEGKAIYLAEEGRVKAPALKLHAVSEADLLEALRKAGVATSEDAKLIVLEPSGNISVLKK